MHYFYWIWVTWHVRPPCSLRNQVKARESGAQYSMRSRINSSVPGRRSQPQDYLEDERGGGEDEGGEEGAVEEKAGKMDGKRPVKETNIYTHIFIYIYTHICIYICIHIYITPSCVMCFIQKWYMGDVSVPWLRLEAPKCPGIRVYCIKYKHVVLYTNSLYESYIRIFCSGTYGYISCHVWHTSMIFDMAASFVPWLMQHTDTTWLMQDPFVLQYTATICCSTLQQYTVTHCNKHDSYRTHSHCNTEIICCNTLQQYSVTNCNKHDSSRTNLRCNTLQEHTATHRNNTQ